ncbi:hypothetical protein SCHIN_v1c01500 [Spiroplasma chinense]|uniref:Uncharacterized protein n=1 Tax=Spiroplasma chinense TaxID=216932 RepID=A0A5B9Y2S9_9MOLU|nr:hypothetical protein [Spiroplasma chinense]QEH61348.1 hypothetical protein SCHIN_v1c01500 [Spiroplasma chinense]
MELNSMNNPIVSPEKMKKKRSIKDIKLTLPKFNGVWLLLWINIKKSFSSKAIIGTGIVYIIIALVFIIVPAKLDIAGEDFSRLMLLVGYILAVFFFVVFLTVVVMNLIKTPMIEGITKIETRAGVPLWKTFLIRYTTFLIVSWFYVLINFILAMVFTTGFETAVFSRAMFLYGPVIFFFILPIFWFPVAGLIALICSLAMGTFLGIFCGAIMAITPMINGLVTLISQQDYRISEQLTNSNKLKFGAMYLQDFYNTVSKEEASGKIFDDKISDIAYAIEENFFDSFELSNLDFNSSSKNNDWEKPDQSSNAMATLKRAIYLGQFNIDSRTDFNTNLIEGTVQRTPLEGLAINKLLTDMYNKVDELMETNDRPTMHRPDYISGPFVEGAISTGAMKSYKVSDMTNWFAKKLPEYKTLFNFIGKSYDKYHELFFANDIYGYSNRGMFEKFDVSNYGNTVAQPSNATVDNTRQFEIYFRYPEYMVLNSVILQSWLNSYSINYIDESIFSDGWGSSSSLSSKAMYEKMEELQSHSTNKKMANIFMHFYMMYTGSALSTNVGDAFVDDGGVGLETRGSTSKLRNIQALAKYSNKAITSAAGVNGLIDVETGPMFKENSVSTTFGFNIQLAIFMYILVAAGFTYLIYLLYSKNARI